MIIRLFGLRASIGATLAIAAIACSSAADGIITSTAPPPTATPTAAPEPAGTPVPTPFVETTPADPDAPAPTPTPERIFAAPTPTPFPVAHFDTDFTDPFAILNPLNADKPVDEREYLRNTPPDAVAPVYTPEYVTTGEADLIPDELVMGVSINGESRAFPIGLMRNREMVNDIIGGVPVLVTWCPICFTGLVHDRRLDGKVLTFGNEGVLFMNAMTWWDHKTASVWSQPWGTAITGTLKGKSLTQIPFEFTTWQSWLNMHPDTLVIVDERGFEYGPQMITDAFVIGVAIQDQALGFYYKSVEEIGVRNDTLGDFPIAVVVNAETREISVLLRNGIGTPADDDVEIPELLTFEKNADGTLTDIETGSTWDPHRGLALSGPLRGAPIQKIPFQSSFDWAWNDFFPGAGLWGDRKR
ncbi:MAG: DUF3179 domain-containing protein [Chloroflexi bacterium]|nr:DUF3179 domain-containing protein [Chloroflexota bacterium]